MFQTLSFASKPLNPSAAAFDPRAIDRIPAGMRAVTAQFDFGDITSDKIGQHVSDMLSGLTVMSEGEAMNFRIMITHLAHSGAPIRLESYEGKLAELVNAHLQRGQAIDATIDRSIANEKRSIANEKAIKRLDGRVGSLEDRVEKLERDGEKRLTTAIEEMATTLRAELASEIGGVTNLATATALAVANSGPRGTKVGGVKPKQFDNKRATPGCTQALKYLDHGVEQPCRDKAHAESLVAKGTNVYYTLPAKPAKYGKPGKPAQNVPWYTDDERAALKGGETKSSA